MTSSIRVRNGSRRAWWGQPTPSGRVYEIPTTVEQIASVALEHSQAGIEDKLDPAERPPNPTWKMVGILLEEIHRLNSLPLLEWNKAEDCSPPKDVMVLGYDPDDVLGCVFPAYVGSDEVWHYWEPELDGDPNVTHWHYPVDPT